MSSVPLHHVWHYTDVDRAFWLEHLDPWLPQRIFDAHTHATERRFRSPPMSEEKRRQYWINEVAESIDAADADRCHRLVFPGREVSCLVFGDPSLESDIEGNNANLPAECVRCAWHCLAIAVPQWSAERLARELNRPRVVGIKPYYTLIGSDATTRDRYLEASIFDFLPHHHLELLNERRAWVTLHVPKAGRLAHPDNLREVREIRRRYPDVTLVIAHLGRSYTMPHAEQSLPQLADDDGLYFDLSAVLNPDVLRFAIETLGPSRLLYGTDNPVFYMRGRQQWHGTSYANRTDYPFYFNREREPREIEARYTLFMYEALRAIKQACEAVQLGRDEIGAIFHGNARRLTDAAALAKQRST
jgi:uncharacterized protein